MFYLLLFSNSQRVDNDRPSQRMDNDRPSQRMDSDRPSQRMDNDRSSQQQRSGESSSSGAWRPKSRPTDEIRELPRAGPTLPTNSGRSDDNSAWRTREKRRLNRFISFRIFSYMYFFLLVGEPMKVMMKMNVHHPIIVALLVIKNNLSTKKQVILYSFFFNSYCVSSGVFV